MFNFDVLCKSFSDDVLRFNPIQIAEWLSDLIGSGMHHSQAELEDRLGVDRTRIGQFLRLMKLPVQTKAKLKDMHDLNEYQIRRMMAFERSALATGSN